MVCCTDAMALWRNNYSFSILNDRIESDALREQRWLDMMPMEDLAGIPFCSLLGEGYGGDRHV